MVTVLISLMLFLLLIGLPILGIYLLFYKKKVENPNSLPAWINNSNLSPDSKNVHIKQFYKQTEKPFTKKWLLEYWHGKRSAFHAWFLFFFIFGITMKTARFASHGLPDNLVQLIINNKFFEGTFAAIFVTYYILISIILWRCAANSTAFNKWFARIFIFVPLIYSINSLSH